MNKFPGKVVSIQNSEHFYLLEVDVFGQIFTALMTEMPASGPFLEIGKNVTVIFKDTEVSLARNLQGLISLRNRFFAVVKKVEIKKILCKITMEWNGYPINSVITAGSAMRMDIKENEIIECLIKANAIALMELNED